MRFPFSITDDEPAKKTTDDLGRCAVVIIDMQDKILQAHLKNGHIKNSRLTKLCEVQMEVLRWAAQREEKSNVFVFEYKNCGQTLECLTTEMNRLCLTPRLIEKDDNSAFENTTLASELWLGSFQTVLLTGIHSYLCMKSTVVDGTQLGFTMVMPSDGHGDYTFGGAYQPSAAQLREFYQLKNPDNFHCSLTAREYMRQIDRGELTSETQGVISL